MSSRRDRPPTRASQRESTMSSRPTDAPKNNGLFLRIIAKQDRDAARNGGNEGGETRQAALLAKRKLRCQASRPDHQIRQHPDSAGRLKRYQKALAKLPHAVGHRPKGPFISDCSSAHTTTVNQHHRHESASDGLTADAGAAAAESPDLFLLDLIERFADAGDDCAASGLKQVLEERKEHSKILAERDDLARTHGELRRHILSSKKQRFEQQKDIQPLSGKFLGQGGLKKVVEVQVVVDGGGTETEPRALTLMPKVDHLVEYIDKETSISYICGILDAEMRCPFAKLDRHFTATKEELLSILDQKTFTQCEELDLFSSGCDIQCNLMELATGNLHTHIDQISERGFDQDTALSLFLGVIFPVVQLKEIHGLNHLDLKPGNYLVCETATDGSVFYDVGDDRVLMECSSVGARLNDFDTAEYSHKAFFKNREPEWGKAVITTPEFSGPEVLWFGDDATWHGQDSFAIGKIMGHLFANQPLDSFLPDCPPKLTANLHEVVDKGKEYTRIRGSMDANILCCNDVAKIFNTVYGIVALKGLPNIDAKSDLYCSKAFQTLNAFCTTGEGSEIYKQHFVEYNLYSGTNDSVAFLRENLKGVDGLEGGLEAFLGLIDLDYSKRATAKNILFDSPLFNHLNIGADTELNDADKVFFYTGV